MLQYLRARTYHTKLKQFLSEDTVVGKDTHPLSQYRYAFVLNNPFKYSDPSGYYAIPVMMEDNFRPAPKTPLKVASSLAKDSKKEEAFQKAEIAQIQTITQKKVANVPSSLKKTIQEIEDYQKAEVAQIQTIHKSTLEVIQKNDARNEENMSRMSDSARKVAEEYNKNKEVLRKVAQNKEEIRNKEVQQRILAQQNEERNKLSQTGSISAVVGFLAFAGFMSIAAVPAGLMVLGGITIGTIATALLGIGFTSGIIGFAAGLTLHNTGSRGTDLAGRSLSNREAQVRKSSGGGIMLANAINILGFTFAAMDYYNANKPTVVSNSNSSNTNQESNNRNQLQSNQDNPTDEMSNINSNKSEGRIVEVNGKSVTLNNKTFDPNFVDNQGRTNIQRMNQGLSPIGTDGKSVHIHHIDQTNDGAVMEIIASEQQQNYSNLHAKTGQSNSLIDRKAFNSWRSDYWQWRSNNLE